MIRDLSELRKRYGAKGKLYVYRLPMCKKYFLAEWIFSVAMARGEYKPGDPCAEITAGNMGLAMAEYCEKFASPLYLVPIGRLSDGVRKKLEKRGVKIIEAKPLDGEEYWRALERTLEEVIKKYGAYSFRQFTNPRHLDFYRGLFACMPDIKVDCVIDKIGTGATLAALGEKFAGAKLYYATSAPFKVDMARYRFFTSPPEQIYPTDKREYDAFAAVLAETEGIKDAPYGALSIYCALLWLRQNPGKSAFVFVGD